MKRKAQENQSWMVAATFAEADEWKVARQFMPAPPQPKVSRLDRVFIAITFAEANGHLI